MLQISDNVFVSGAFSFRIGEVETVDVVVGGVIGTVTGLQVKTIKIGAQGVSIFLGDGLAAYDIDDDLATYLSDQHPAMVVTGETVGNLVDGKIYRLVGATLTAPNLTPGGGAGQDYSNPLVWRPVAATYLAGESASVATGETVGVWVTALGTYRVFERTGAATTMGALSSLVSAYQGAGWVEVTVFHNGDGTLNADEIGADAVGFFLEDAALGLVLANAQTAQDNPLNNAHKGKKFTALKATAESVSLVGFEDAGFTFTLRGIVVEVNSGSPAFGGLKPTIDWAASFPVTGGYEVQTGDPDHPMLIDFRGTPLIGVAAEHAVLQISDNVFVSGAFSFRMGEVETVNVVVGGLVGTVTGLQVKTIKIGAEGVSIFLGDGLADYDIDDDIATYMSNAHPAMVVTGETVGNLVDGKIYRLVGTTLTSPNLTPGGGTGQNYSDTAIWRPVAADHLAGETASVATGETVGVWVAALGTYRVFERTGAATLSGALSSLVSAYQGAGWVEVTVFHNGDGTLNAAEIGDAAGFFIEDAALGLVLANARTPQSNPVNSAYMGMKFTALKATAASAGLVGFEDAGFTFTVRGIVVEVNSGSPAAGVAPTIDWAGSFASTGGYEVQTGDPDHPMLIDFRGTPLLGFAAAHVVLQISDNVFISGAFSVRLGEVETVNVVQGGLLGDITGLQVKTIKVGAQGVSIFVGDGLSGYDIDDDIATYLSDEHPATVLTGETVGNLLDGKIYRFIGTALTSPDLTPGGVGQTYSDTSLWRPVAATYLAGESPSVGGSRRDGRCLGRDGRDLPGVQAHELGVCAGRRAAGDCGQLHRCRLGRAAGLPQRRRHSERG